MRLSKFLVFLLLSCLLISCNNSPREIKIIHTGENSGQREKIPADNYESLKVAVSAILSPRETFRSYEGMFQYISMKTGIPIEFQQRKTYREINQMLETGQIDFAFICSGAYIELNQDKDVEILAIPHCHGQSFYKAYIIVNTSSTAKNLDDLKKSSIALTDPMSNSGYLYVKHRLQENGDRIEDFFSSAQFSYGHDLSIQMVAKGIADAASVSQFVYEYYKHRKPEVIQNIRILEASNGFGMPPVVVSSRMSREMRQKVFDLLVNMHNDPEGARILEDLMIDSFHKGNDDDYNSIRKMRDELKR
jgi:phosphonate transport system substrate-binding protein